MRKFLYSIKKFPNYLGRFGFYSGLQLFIIIEWRLFQSAFKQVIVKLPQTDFPVYLRPTIADFSAFWICLVAEQYSTSPFPQSDRLSAVYEDMLEKGKRPLIIDIGENIGMSALWFAQKYPEARIIAIEPNRENYELLEKNIRPYKNQIASFFGGVWPKDVGLIIENPEAGAQHYRTREVPLDTKGALNATTIKTILKKAEVDEIFIVKIDIEGGQAALFKENTSWVKKNHLIVLELDDWKFPWKGTSRSFFSCVSKYSFGYLLHGENIFCFQDLGNGGNSTK